MAQLTLIDIEKVISMESNGCLKVNIGKMVDAQVRILDRIYNLHDQINKSLGGGVIVYGAPVRIYDHIHNLHDQINKS